MPLCGPLPPAAQHEGAVTHRLDVAVEYAVLVQVRHRVRHLHKQLRRLLLAVLRPQLVQPVDDLAAPAGQEPARRGERARREAARRSAGRPPLPGRRSGSSAAPALLAAAPAAWAGRHRKCRPARAPSSSPGNARKKFPNASRCAPPRPPGNRRPLGAHAVHYKRTAATRARAPAGGGSGSHPGTPLGWGGPVPAASPPRCAAQHSTAQRAQRSGSAVCHRQLACRKCDLLQAACGTHVS